MKPGRNDHCSCGSGKKFKKCCASEAATSRAALPTAHVIEPTTMARFGVLIQTGRHEELEAQVRQFLDLHPPCGPAWQFLGLALWMQGKDALPALTRAATLLPENSEAHGNLGNAQRRAGKLQESVASHRRALALQPDSAQAHNDLGSVLQELGALAEAIASYRAAIAAQPLFATAHENLAEALRLDGQWADAAASYRRVLALRADAQDPHVRLASLLHEVGQADAAESSYRRALALPGHCPEAEFGLANICADRMDFVQAVQHYQRALHLKADYAEAHCNLGVVHRQLGHIETSQACAVTALAINPGLASALVLLAQLHGDQGEFAAAEAQFERAIALDPTLPEAWAGFAALRRMTRDDESWAATAQQLIAGGLAPRGEAHLRFALGKYFDDCGEFSQAFTNYARANQLTKLRHGAFDRAGLTRSVDEIIRTYSHDWLEEARRHGDASARPIFIVGMPRSGTTLAEQILASHPLIAGAGELSFWSEAALQDAALGLPAGPESLRSRCRDYLALLAKIAPQALRVIDKMPANFSYMGQIHAAFPQAKIIHMQRGALDTCLSIFCHPFQGSHPYADDLEDLAYYYREYVRLMAHWQACLPAQSLLNLPYEALTEDAEGWSRKLVDFIGVPWHADVLEFHRTRRTVTTFSKWQVRQKIHRGSVNRWRNYRPFLGPLLSLQSINEVPAVPSAPLP